MRYEDIDPAFDPLMKNLTTDSTEIIGVHAPESRIYFSINGSRRKGLNTDIGGKFEFTIESLEIGDIILFEYKVRDEYEEFWKEIIRE
ncbi:hypothetical protein [Listeria booriae]|uniref:hypothetical protein n=1 Tax=Listeria booriae TaxID=1552123 RepID=UPI0016256CFC|nr:hypothetical protein [Listeria booriae]MBC2106150.1 hypothetical protein [Listeria booriae]